MARCGTTFGPVSCQPERLETRDHQGCAAWQSIEAQHLPQLQALFKGEDRSLDLRPSRATSPARLPEEPRRAGA
jgi:hypothetical protein